MEQFESEQVRLDLDERRGRRVAEPGVGVGSHRLEFGRAEVVDDEFGHDPHGRIGVAQSAKRPDRVRPPRGESERRIKSTVAGEAGQQRVRKAKGRRRPARRNIMHELEILSRFARRLSQKPRKENGGGHALTNGAKPRQRAFRMSRAGVGWS